VGAPPYYLTVHNSTETAKSNSALRYFTLVEAKVAGSPGLSSGRIFRQTIGFTGTRVNLLDLRPDLLKVGSDTIYTVSYYV